MNEDNNLEELEGKVQGQLEESGRKVARKTSKAVGKAVKKVATTIGKAIGKLAIKLIAMIGPIGWMIIAGILILLAVVSILYGAYDTAYESRGKEQEYQDQTIQENNELEIDENGDYNVSALSRGNKTVQAFYTYFSNESYYKLIGDDKTLYKANEKEDIKDKYEREKMFYLNPNMLWTLDEYLNKDEFRFPEQFVQPVAYDPDTLELRNLCDEDGRLKVKSYDYSKKNNSSDSDTSSNEEEKVEEVLGIIYIGDSRTVGLEKAITKASNEFFVAKSNEGYDWFVNTAISKVNQIIEDNPKFEKWTIISNLGINDMNYQLSNYISKYNELLNGDWSSYTFCFQSINPVDESKSGVSVTNAQIETFNEAIKQGVPNAKYINTYTTIKNNFNSSDGVHYDDETYIKIYNTIQNEQPVGSIVVDKEDSEDEDKVFGTWDYGFAPILHYVEKEELKEIEGSYVQEDYWDEKDQEIKTRDINEDYYQMVDGYPKTVYMIDKVISSAGTIENQIESPKIQGGAYVNKELYDERDVDIYDWVTHTSTKTNEDGTTSTTTTKKWEKVGTRHIKLYKYIQAYYYDTIPRYVGEPDTSKITGNKYFVDYMTTYETYVPDNVMGKFDFKARTGKDETDEEIEKILGADESISNAGEGTSEKTDGDVNMDSFELGSGASGDVYKKAIQHIALFKEWGETYGVDPYLLVAQACQESGGDHEATLVGGSKYNGAAVGIMQVEKPGVVITKVTAYNFKTKQYDTINITGPADVSDISDNIRVGAMELAERMKDNKGNILLALQGYNMGQGGISNVVRASGLTMDQAKSDPSNLTWMAYRHIQAGDPKYIENVLRYYASPDNKVPYVILEDGTRYEANGSIETGFASGLSVSGAGNSFWGKIRSFFSKLVELFNDIFPDHPEKLSDNRILFSNKIPENQTTDIITMMFSMNEMKYFSEYEITDKFWKEKYKDLFKSPLGTTWGSSISVGINPTDYFPNGYTSPIKVSGATIGKNFGNVTNGDSSEYHDGIDIIVPEGTPVYAVADGTVETVKNTATDKSKGKYVKLSHAKNIETIYGNLESISVKEGDTVKKGDQIGVVGKSSSDDGLHFELINDGTNEDGSWIVTGQGLSTGGATAGPQSIEGSEVAKKAYEAIAPYIGSWYAWGGTTPPYRNGDDWVTPKGTGRYVGGQEVTTPGFDCSGLMWYGYKQAGVEIPRTSQEQQKNLKSVSKEDIQPGDLIFIGNPAHHVGMYIGNDQYIHAPQTGKRVTIATVNWSRVSSIGRVAE